MTQVQQFQTFTSVVEPLFWKDLSRRKLDELRLSTDPVPVYGVFGCSNTSGAPARFSLPGDALQAKRAPAPNQIAVPGTVVNFNTLDDFRTLDKDAVLQDLAQTLVADIDSGAVDREPERLFRFVVLSFADIKRHHFLYWFAFPALMPSEPFQRGSCARLADALSATQAAAVHTAFAQLRARRLEEGLQPPVVFALRFEGGDAVTAHTLTELELLPSDAEVVFVVWDPSSLPKFPGWTARNTLFFILRRFPQFVRGQRIRLLCWRLHPAHATSADSLMLEVQLPTAAVADLMAPPLRVVGWEADPTGALRPRAMDLSGMFDPTRLAEEAVDLNVKLMRWRVLPTLKQEAISGTRCLLLGAGTLGCNVARALLGWGVRHITLVDYGRVSFSNPVRQSLFEFADCLEGGKPKAATAAAALKRIFPSVVTEGISLSIPMPGHAPANAAAAAEARAAYGTLDQLISNHDVTFLLTDSRESRWLPTALCRLHCKLAINVALGFDSYVVMRHGVTSAGDSDDAVPHLGCYFCSDVVAPRDSLTARTLDQQCTVTRPGLAYIASATAVELLVALLHHPLRAAAPASDGRDENDSADESPLGLLPQQIRGYIDQHQTLVMAGRPFTRCSACSPKIVQLLRERGVEMVMDALSRPALLEEWTGLAELQRATAAGLDEAVAALDVSEAGEDVDDF